MKCVLSVASTWLNKDIHICTYIQTYTQENERVLQMERKWERARERECRGLWERMSGAIKAGTSVQSLRANRVSDMNLAQARWPLTFSQKPLGDAAELLSSSFCLTLPDLLCLPSAQVHYVHLFHRYNSLHINCSFLLSALFTFCRSRPFMAQTEPLIHQPDMTVLC